MKRDTIDKVTHPTRTPAPSSLGRTSHPSLISAYEMRDVEEGGAKAEQEDLVPRNEAAH